MSERSYVELWQMYSPKTTLPQTAFINLGRNIALPCRHDHGNYIEILWRVCARTNGLILQTKAVYHCQSSLQITKLELCRPFAKYSSQNVFSV